MSEQVTKIDCEQLRAWGACYYHHEPANEVDARMREWMGGDSVTPLAAMDLDVVPVVDRIWIATRPAVLSERSLRHLACDFAEHVLPHFEDAYPDDRRPRTAIEVARRYADGETTKQEMREAANAAASAARAASASPAASAAASAAAAAYAAASASPAAYAAYDDAAYAAAAAERKWQLERCRHWLSIQEQA